MQVDRLMIYHCELRPIPSAGRQPEDISMHEAVPSAGRQPDDILVTDGLFPVQVEILRIYLCMMTYLQCR